MTTIDEIEALLARAGKRPWRKCTASDGKCRCGLVWSIGDDRVVASFSYDEHTNATDYDHANADLVERLVNAAPDLIAVVRAAAESVGCCGCEINKDLRAALAKLGVVP